MAMVKVQIIGLNKVITGLNRLPKSVTIRGEEESERLMKKIRKSAKLRAPKWSGALAESITLSKTSSGNKKQWILSVGSPYGIFWEVGFKAHKVNPNRSTRSGFRVVDWMADKGIAINGQPLLVGVGRKNPTPFIKPAFEKNILGFGDKLNRSIHKGIKEAFK